MHMYLDDPYTHRDACQYTPARWYFHRRGGTFKGLDVTCHGGSFLLRAIQNLETGTVIEGPSLLVDCILDKTGYQFVNDLRTNYTHPAMLNTNFCLEKRRKHKNKRKEEEEEGERSSPVCEARDRVAHVEEEIFTDQRIGLRYQEERKDYWAQPLRFFIKPHLLKKGRRKVVAS